LGCDKKGLATGGKEEVGRRVHGAALGQGWDWSDEKKEASKDARGLS